MSKSDCFSQLGIKIDDVAYFLFGLPSPVITTYDKEIIVISYKGIQFIVTCYKGYTIYIFEHCYIYRECYQYQHDLVGVMLVYIDAWYSSV